MSKEDEIRDLKLAEAVAETKATRGIVESRMVDIQRQLNMLVGLPVKVAQLWERADGIEKRVTDLEHVDNRGREWWRASFPPLAVSLIALALSLAHLI